jgi:hypothetical protein
VEALIDIPFDLDTESMMKQVHVVPGTDDAREFQDLLNMAKSHVWGQPNYERIVRGKRVALFCSE